MYKASSTSPALRDDSLEDIDNLPPPEVITQEIVEDLEAALAEFSAIAGRPVAARTQVTRFSKRATWWTQVSDRWRRRVERSRLRQGFGSSGRWIAV